ncbi:MAG: methionyl-tRNA formyltransferase [Candidatus Moraniibacteriota bacterium]
MLEILTGEQQTVLRQQAMKVKDPLSDEIRALIPEMIETMRHAEGTGLAAPQIGKSIRLFVIEVGERVYVFINPVITKKSEKTVLYEEGCLSLPGLFFDIERSERITLDYQNQHGSKKTLTTDGLLAIVIQHEMDHLDGVLIVDRFRDQSIKLSPWISDVTPRGNRVKNVSNPAPIADIVHVDIPEPVVTATKRSDPDSTPKINVVFMGTPPFSASLLTVLIDGGYHIVAVFTRPDKESGRGKKIMPSAVKDMAIAHGIPVEQPHRFDDDSIAKLRSYKPDLIVVAAYGRILPKTVLDMPGFGCINVHTSLLPRWRGASPVQNTLISGDTETGVTLMLMDEGVDTGDIIATSKRSIADDDTYHSLLGKLASDAANLLIATLPSFVERTIEPKKQDGAQATLCQLIERDDGRIFWNDSAMNIHNRFRGLSPWPGIFSFWKQKDGGYVRLKFTKLSIWDDDADTRSFGEVFEADDRIAVQTGSGIVFIDEIQPEGKKPMPVRDFINGRPDFLGSILG